MHGCVYIGFELAPTFIQMFAIFTENRKFLPQNVPQKASQSSGKSAHLTQHAANDRLHLFDATCAHRWPQSRRFFNFDHAELREFQTQSCAISSRKCAQRATKARRVNPSALHAVWQLPATSAQLLPALGACRAQKSLVLARIKRTHVQITF